MTKEFYRRRLPHWQPKNGVFDVTFRLIGTLPKAKILELKKFREEKIKELRKKFKDEEELQIELQHYYELYFGKFDHLLNNEDFGPTWLKHPEITAIVAEAFHYRHEQGIFKLVCFSIMSNHVHVVFYNLQKPLNKVLESLKRHTARQSNIILNRTGHHFWQPESFDHNIRNRPSLQRRIIYNLNNPVDAGLCTHWTDWGGNYLNPDFKEWMPD